MKKSICILILSCCTILLLQSCNPNADSSTPIPPEPQVMLSTATSEATATKSPPTALPTATTVSRLNGQVAVVSINLREGPGTVHNILGDYPNGAGIIILSQTPDGEWVKVETNDNQVGWMSRQFVKIDGEWHALTHEERVEDIVVTGQVVNNAGIPINDITIACVQTLNGVDQRTDTRTNEVGIFKAYLPSKSSGIWSVAVVGVGCDSWISTEDCDYAGYFDDYGQTLVELPQEEPVIFIYQE